MGTLLPRLDCRTLLDTRPRGVAAVCVQWCTQNQTTPKRQMASDINIKKSR